MLTKLSLVSALLLPTAALGANEVQTISYGTDGTLLEPLPQIGNKDEVEFVIGGVAGGLDTHKHLFWLRHECRTEATGWKRVEFEDGSGQLVAPIDGDCLEAGETFAWEIEASTHADLDLQRVLHPAIEAYLYVFQLAESKLGRRYYELSDREWGRLQGYMSQANMAIKSVEMGRYLTLDEYMIVAGADEVDGSKLTSRGMSGDTKDAYKAVLDISASFDTSPQATRPSTEAEWEALAQVASEAFWLQGGTKLDDVVAKWQEEQSEEKAKTKKPQGVESADAEETEDETEDAGTETADEQVEEQADTSAEEADTAEEEDSCDTLEACMAEAMHEMTLPKDWLACGETAIGNRDRVVSVDMNGLRFGNSAPAVDDWDEVWLAVANHKDAYRKAVEIVSTGEDHPDHHLNIAGKSRGDDEEGIKALPNLKIRADEPSYQLDLEAVGRLDGNSIVTYTFAGTGTEEGRETAVSFKVARTYHIGFKYGIVVPDNRQAEAIVGLSGYFVPHDPIDDIRRENWQRVVPHVFLGWAPTDMKRAYLGLGLEPWAGIALIGGATLGHGEVLDSEGEWVTSDETYGYFLGLTADISILAKIFGKTVQGFETLP